MQALVVLVELFARRLSASSASSFLSLSLILCFPLDIRPLSAWTMPFARGEDTETLVFLDRVLGVHSVQDVSEVVARSRPRGMHVQRVH